MQVVVESLNTLKEALNLKFKDMESSFKDRTFHIVDLDYNENNNVINAKTKVTLTNRVFEDETKYGKHAFMTDEHFFINLIFDNTNTKVKQTSTFTIEFKFNGDTKIENITKEQFFNIQTKLKNELFNDLTDQETIEKCIEINPHYAIDNNKASLELEPFKVNIIQ